MQREFPWAEVPDMHGTMPDRLISTSDLFAAVLFEIRLLLGPRPHDPDAQVRQAAMLAYALHNDALGELEGRGVDPDVVLNRLGEEQGVRLLRMILGSKLAQCIGAATKSIRQEGASETVIVPFVRDAEDLIRGYPEQRSHLATLILSEWANGRCAWEVLAHLMHLVRWVEVRAVIAKELKASISADDWRAIPVLRHVLDAWEDDWDGRNLLPELYRPSPPKLRGSPED